MDYKRLLKSLTDISYEMQQFYYLHSNYLNNFLNSGINISNGI